MKSVDLTHHVSHFVLVQQKAALLSRLQRRVYNCVSDTLMVLARRVTVASMLLVMAVTVAVVKASYEEVVTKKDSGGLWVMIVLPLQLGVRVRVTWP